MVTIENLKEHYFFREIDRDFPIGRRSNLRYAFPTASAYLTKINPKGPEPFEYLAYAKADISSGSLQGAINALGNAKRAVHLIIHGFLRLMGLDKAYARTDFPERLNLLRSLDAFPTQVLNNLNRTRNLVEHEYTEVSVDETMSFVEIAEMLLLLTYPLLKNAVVGVCVGIEGDPRCLEWYVSPQEGNICICEVEATHFINTPSGPVYYSIWPKDKHVQINTVNISRSNTEEWIPYLDLFVFCTKKAATQLPKASAGDGELVSSRHSFDYLSVEETDESITMELRTPSD